MGVSTVSHKGRGFDANDAVLEMQPSRRATMARFCR